jgi:probable HAF family extracellular repeat protein
MRRIVLGLVLALLAGLTTACVPPAARYSVTDLGTLGGDRSAANDINNAGQIVGWTMNASNRMRAFSFDGSGMVDLGTLGGSEAAAEAVNDGGDIAGSARAPGDVRNRAFLSVGGAPMVDLGTLGGAIDTAVATDVNRSGDVVGGSPNRAGDSHAFLRGPSTSDVMTDLGALDPGGFSTALAINDNGDIVGQSETPGGQHHAFLKSGLYTGGLMVDLGTLGGTFSRASDVNLSGFIVGSANLASGQRHAMGIVYGGAMVDLGTLGGPDSDARAVNNDNIIVGTSTTAGGQAHAFIHDGFTMVDLNTLIPANSGWELFEASSINDLGQIVGWGRHGATIRAFLLTP